MQWCFDADEDCLSFFHYNFQSTEVVSRRWSNCQIWAILSKAKNPGQVPHHKDGHLLSLYWIFVTWWRDVIESSNPSISRARGLKGTCTPIRVCNGYFGRALGENDREGVTLFGILSTVSLRSQLYRIVWPLDQKRLLNSYLLNSLPSRFYQRILSGWEWLVAHTLKLGQGINQFDAGAYYIKTKQITFRSTPNNQQYTHRIWHGISSGVSMSFPFILKIEEAEKGQRKKK